MLQIATHLYSNLLHSVLSIAVWDFITPSFRVPKKLLIFTKSIIKIALKLHIYAQFIDFAFDFNPKWG